MGRDEMAFVRIFPGDDRTHVPEREARVCPGDHGTGAQRLCSWYPWQMEARGLFERNRV